MKIRIGGGGVDKDGNGYKLPDQEVEVENDYFQKLIEAMRDMPAPTHIMTTPWVAKMIKRMIGR